MTWGKIIGSCVCVLGFFLIMKKEPCLFYYRGKCYTCADKNNFWVGLPENCTLCPYRSAQYNDSHSVVRWACLGQQKEKQEIPFQNRVPSSCPPKVPLQDILGHCYPCSTTQPVRLENPRKNVCQGKRYLTKFRLSEKSHLCPPLHKIKNPEICFSCRGTWIQEKCLSFSNETPLYCTENTDCPSNEYCYPFRYQYHGKTGVCCPQTFQKWICSDTDGYTPQTARLFCERQGAHLADLNSIMAQKTDILKTCPHEKIWIFFKEGSLFLGSIKDNYPITNEALSANEGGDNFYALCQKD